MRYFALLLATATVGLGQYATFAETERKLVDLARANPGVMSLEVIGSSAGGRKIHGVRLAAQGAVAPESRPAVFVGANLVGFHNAGTQAALGLIESLLAKPELLGRRTFYVLPMLNPDAQDHFFARVKWRNGLNGGRLDRDRDGLVGEDGPDDLNGDGRITQMRIADPHGAYLPDPADGRVMRRADPLKGEKGQFQVYGEGRDEDRDGRYNEDAAGGARPDRNFAHAWADDDPESGPYPGSEPEARAVMDYVLARRNIALAFVFGPANNLLSSPRGAGGAVDLGQVRVTPQGPMAQALGIEARTYAVDELVSLLQNSAAALRLVNEVTRESIASLMGAGAATSPTLEDVRYYESLGEEYRRTLEKAGLDGNRDGRQSAMGGLQNWLYFHYGAMAVELDVWGVPKKRGGAGEVAEVMAYVDANSPASFVPWTALALPDGTKVEVGGVDPFVEIAPPAGELAKAVAAHAEFIQSAASKLAAVKILTSEAKPLANGLWRVTATAGNVGLLPTHTQHAVRARTWLPVRLAVGLPAGVTLVSGKPQVASERLTGGVGQMRGEWLVRAPAGTKLSLTVASQNAGEDRREITLQ